MNKFLFLIPFASILNSSTINDFICEDNKCEIKNIKEKTFTIGKVSIHTNNKVKLTDLKSIYKLNNISKLKELRIENISIFKDNFKPTLNISNIFIKNDIIDAHGKFILNGNIFAHAKGIKYIHDLVNEKIFLKDKQKFIGDIIKETLYSADISTEEEISFLTPYISNTLFHMLDGLFSIDMKVNFKEIINNEEITYDIKLRSYNNMYLDIKVIFKIHNYGYEIYKSEPKLDLIVKRIKIKGFTSFGKLNKDINNDELYIFLIDKYKYHFINVLEERIENNKFFKENFQEKELIISIMENTFNMFSGTHFINIDYINTEDVKFDTLIKEILF